MNVKEGAGDRRRGGNLQMAMSRVPGLSGMTRLPRAKPPTSAAITEVFIWNRGEGRGASQKLGSSTGE